MEPFRLVAPSVYAAREPKLSVNVGLVVGQERALLVDTGSGPATAEALWAELREITELPVVVVNTHAHFDHIYGNARLAALGVEEFWAHPRLPHAAEASHASQRKAAQAVDPSMAEGLPYAELHLPNRLLSPVEGADGAVTPVEIDLGGLTAALFHLGRGHSDSDLLVGAGGVLFAGDLVEQGGDPHFEDSFPDEWVRVLGKITALEELYSVVVPGHGAPVDMSHVKLQRATMRQALKITRSAMNEATTDLTKAVPILPYGPAQSRALLRRLRELSSQGRQPGR